LQDVAERSHEDARAARLAPHATVAGAGLAAVVVARIELPIVDPQFAVEQVQLFDAGVDVRRVSGSGGEPNQHADAFLRDVGREQLA